MDRDPNLIEAAVEALACGIYIADRNDRLLYVNPRLATMSGYSRDELIGMERSVLEPRRAMDAAEGATAPAATADEMDQPPQEGVLRRADGSLIRVLETRRALGDDGQVVGSIMPAAGEVLSQHAVSFELERELARSVRHGTPIAILLVGVDPPSAGTPPAGTLADDEPIIEPITNHITLEESRALAATIGATLRPSDRVGQAGPDSFLVLLPHTEHAGARATAERMRQAVNDRRTRVPGPSVSIAIAAIGAQRAHNPRALAHTADSLLEMASEELAVLREMGPDRIGG